MRSRWRSCGTRLLALLVGVCCLGSAERSATPLAPHARVDLRIPVTLFEDAGVARRAPVEFGLPLPLSAQVLDVRSLEIEGPTGAAVPVQATVLSRWDAPPGDGAAPIRWALLRTRADLPAGGTTVIQVRHGEKNGPASGHATPGSPLARLEGGSISVDTGRFRAV